jgi:very-short-patch-repair endonuclease
LIGPVWEPRFASALRKAGIDFQQQYPACGFYLDFAIIRGSSKLAVEVDGESYHRDAKGKLRIEDVRRDLILKAAGWQVERFWVYQLRENLDGCIERVRTVLRES